MTIDALFYSSLQFHGTYLIAWVEAGRPKAREILESYVNNTLGLGNFINNPEKYPDFDWRYEKLLKRKILDIGDINTLTSSTDADILRAKTFDKKQMIDGRPLTIIESELADEMIVNAEVTLGRTIDTISKIFEHSQTADDRIKVGGALLDLQKCIYKGSDLDACIFKKPVMKAYLQNTWLFCDTRLCTPVEAMDILIDRMDTLLALIHAKSNEDFLDYQFRDKMADPWA